VVQNWSPELARDFREFSSWLEVRSSPRNNSKKRNDTFPYWLQLPIWLAKSYSHGNGRRPVSPHFLDDILWGQFCLFYFTKIHDDVFDQHTGHLSLVFAGDELLLEAYRVFLRYFEPSSVFWQYLDSCIRDTLKAIMAVDKLQRTSYSREVDVLRLYIRKKLCAKGYAICKTATYAICIRAGRQKDFPFAEAFADEFALVGQVLDDFDDMKDDLDRGRLNSAASFLLRYGSSGRSDRSRAKERIARNVVGTAAVGKLFDELRLHLDKAGKKIGPLKLREAEEHISSFKLCLDSYEERLHRQRIELMMSLMHSHVMAGQKSEVVKDD
jgi:hypothetical protein